ncbi:unnamed protein product [Macrosiphum euphorbiae]|uniref:Uncharacterized protein n=1 Tax=Macrosiphum euphorbiae TaxID=13131 RepID=A0AAV0WXL3_9HEMI|nr:unnamed protein product [Macrosiphum euphorbiae]
MYVTRSQSFTSSFNSDPVVFGTHLNQAHDDPLDQRVSNSAVESSHHRHLLRIIASSEEFRDGSSTLHQLLTVLRPLVRAVGVVSQPPPLHPRKIEDDTIIRRRHCQR